jgi:oxalate---CoA ligase
MPLFHIHGLIAAVLGLARGGRLGLVRAGLRRAEVLRLAAEARPTWYTAVPTMHQAILTRAGRNKETIARCRCGSSARPRPRCRRR